MLLSRPPAVRRAAGSAAALLLLALGVPPAAPAAGEPDATATFRGSAGHAGVYAPPPGHAFGGIRWSFVTGGSVRSSPAIAGGLVYAGSTDGGLYALDERDGRLRWRYDAGSAVAASPAVAGGLVYAQSYDGDVFAVRTADGREAWKRSLGPAAPLAWGHESGDVYRSSPVVAGERLLVGGLDGRLYALDARTGAVAWRLQTGGRIWSSPAIRDGAVYAGSQDGKLYCADLRSGALRWTFATDGAALRSAEFGYDRRTIQSSPSVAGGIVYVGSRDGTLYAVDAANGTLRWRFDNSVFWSNTTPAIDGGLIYDGNSDGRFVQAVDARSGVQAWKFTTQQPVFASPSVAGDAVYTGDWSGTLYALDARSGAALWQWRSFGRRILSSVAIDGGHLVFGSDDGRVYDLRIGASALERAVYFDDAHRKSSHLRSSEAVRDFLAKRGYAVLDDAQLSAFLRDRIADRKRSVIVFAIDDVPASAVGDVPARGLFRRYLDAGGKVVWPGVPPLMMPPDPKTGMGDLLHIGRDASGALLGVSFAQANFDPLDATPTAAGVAWGLGGTMYAAWDADPATVTTVLAEDEQHLAGAWVRNYGGPPGTGFVQLQLNGTVELPAANLVALQLAAEHFPD
ncbi:MAG TPA: PQQ-binding-like beta-propeller repeat protein [Candidatus Elarobacter sp.]|nr:PQQ-binding-like beta-propeller repeat protein [Candidatus Elarobacter sp.]